MEARIVLPSINIINERFRKYYAYFLKHLVMFYDYDCQPINSANAKYTKQYMKYDFNKIEHIVKELEEMGAKISINGGYKIGGEFIGWYPTNLNIKETDTTISITTGDLEELGRFMRGGNCRDELFDIYIHLRGDKTL